MMPYGHTPRVPAATAVAYEQSAAHDSLVPPAVSLCLHWRSRALPYTWLCQRSTPFS
jgi:hypothetical protein